MFRIYPLAVFFVLLVFLCNVPQDVWGSGTAPHDSHTIAANLLLAQNVMGTAVMFGPLWSLPLEVQMYLMLPLVFYLVRRISPTTLLVLWGISVLCGLAYLPFRSSGHILWRLDVIIFVPCFLGGAVAYQVAQRSRPLLPGWLWPLTIAAVLNVYLAFERQRYGWMACLLLGLSVPFFAQIQQAWLTRGAKWIATYSYGIYLSNIVILWFAFRICARWMPRFAVWSVFVAGAVLIPVACFHWIEKPLMKMGGALADRFFRTEAA
jgi:peptidoglycan/LPS O-acetylase OafA/YrhL